MGYTGRLFHSQPLPLMPTVMLTGPRHNVAAQSDLIPAVVIALLRSGRSISVGCATGVDQKVITTALENRFAHKLNIFCAFGASGAGWIEGCSAPYALIESAAHVGATIYFWAGGAPGLPESGRGIPPATVRLARRSLACVRSAHSIVGFADRHPAEPFARGEWPSCGSGTWASIAAAAQRSLTAVVFPLYRGKLPPLTVAGDWTPTADSGLWSHSQRFNPSQSALEF